MLRAAIETIHQIGGSLDILLSAVQLWSEDQAPTIVSLCIRQRAPIATNTPWRSIPSRQPHGGKDMTDDAFEAVIEALRDLARWLYRQLEREYRYLSSDTIEHVLSVQGRRYSRIFSNVSKTTRNVSAWTELRTSPQSAKARLASLTILGLSPLRRCHFATSARDAQPSQVTYWQLSTQEKELNMSSDRYTKIVLTIIAAALVFVIFRFESILICSDLGFCFIRAATIG